MEKEEKKEVLEGEDLRSHIQEMAKSLVMDNIEIYTRQSKYPEEWDLEGLENYVMNLFDINKKFLSFTDIESITKEALIDKIIEKAEEKI